MDNLVLYIIIGLVILFALGVKIVRPTHRALIERLGKYNRFANAGFHWIIPFIDKMYIVNITEQMIDAEAQEIITNDNLNASVDAQVYFRVIANEENVKNSQYNVNRYQWQIVNLARTTLRNIIGTLTLRSANSERGKINAELHKTLMEETKSWGIEVIRTELKQIDPPSDVQETMNKVVKAENEKIAATETAPASTADAGSACARSSSTRRTAAPHRCSTAGRGWSGSGGRCAHAPQRPRSGHAPRRSRRQAGFRSCAEDRTHPPCPRHAKASHFRPGRARSRNNSV